MTFLTATTGDMHVVTGVRATRFLAGHVLLEVNWPFFSISDKALVNLASGETVSEVEATVYATFMIWSALAAAILLACSALFCLARSASFSCFSLCSSFSSSVRILANLVIKLDGAGLDILELGDSGRLEASSSFLFG